MISETTKKQGKRLTDLLKSKHKKQSEIYNKYMSQYDLGPRKVMFCDYCHGRREIPHDLLVDISKELDVDVGYLIGADRFKYESYEEYCKFYRLMNDHNFNKYDLMFRSADYLFSSSNEEDDSVIYTASHNGASKTFTENDMEGFYQRILAYIQAEFNKYFSSDYVPTDKAGWVTYYRYYPERFELLKDRLSKEEIEQIMKEGDADD